jgi:glycine/D-amino acid oxidase-like deaminating enzyme/nitrite reductase/ring-hydroxylating ferredoxin subunit
VSEPRDPAPSLWIDRNDGVASGPFPRGVEVDAVVAGAGLTGLTTALMLQEAGLRVVVIEARRVGAVTTGRSTAKLSLLHGTNLSKIVSAHNEEVARAYVDGNRAGKAWLQGFLAEQDVPVEIRDSFVYAGSEKATKSVRREYEVAEQAGLPVVYLDRAEELPYPSFGAVRLADQAQFDPIEVVAALARVFTERGGTLVEGVRVTGIESRGRPTISTPDGTLTAEHVVLATGLPVADRGLYWAKTMPQRSYALAFEVDEVDGEVPEQQYVSADQPTRSLRTAVDKGRKLLLVGGNGHTVGQQTKSTASLVDDLTGWTLRHFPGARLTHAWSAQDYQSHNHVPFVGRLPRGSGQVWLATGYGKWGMSNAPTAALNLTARILDTDVPEWAQILGRRITKPPGLAQGLQANARVFAAASAGWVAAEAAPLDESRKHPPEGYGTVGRHQGVPVAVSQTDGVTCAVSAVCTHLGGIVRFNEHEQSWDCPLHGSRFAADGTVLEGPATRPLSKVDSLSD